MDPENDAVESQSTAPAEDARPAWATDALDVLIGDEYGEDEAESPEGEPAEDAAQEPEGDEAEPIESGDDATDAEASDDDAPSELKEILKKLSRSERGKAIQHFRAQAEQRLKEAQEIEERTRAAAAAREAKAAEIRERRGKYIGEVESQRADGTPIPTYKELERLLTTRGGDDVLDEKYGMSRDEALELKESWDERRAMLDGSLDDFRTEAWVEAGKKLATSVAESGLPIETIWQGVQAIEDVVPSVVRHLKAAHQAELSAVKQEYESRLRAANANGPAVAAKAAAKRLPTPESGGRGDASGKRIYTESEIADPAFFREHEEDIDLAYAEGRIRPG